ncbi:MAG TPA: hypothetical protein VFR86_09920 [Burkholderiaceae bacterium]|nr:hypothetical protein [Burkholderiaceae bacterium]
MSSATPLLGPSLLALLFAAGPAQAIEVDAGECREASQFIGNAALSRDNGMSKANFVGRLDEDLVILESIPPESRWFAHGEAEARFLRDAVLEVFDAPRLPVEHARDFLANCLRVARLIRDDELEQGAPESADAERARL